MAHELIVSLLRELITELEAGRGEMEVASGGALLAAAIFVIRDLTKVIRKQVAARNGNAPPPTVPPPDMVSSELCQAHRTHLEDTCNRIEASTSKISDKLNQTNTKLDTLIGQMEAQK